MTIVVPGDGGGGGGGIDTITSGTLGVTSPSGPTTDIELNASGATPGSYGDATHVAVVTIDIYGRVTGLTSVAISAGGTGTVSLIQSPGSTIAVTGGSGPTTRVDLPNVGTAQTVGDSTHVAQVQTDAYGRVVGLTSVAIATPISADLYLASNFD